MPGVASKGVMLRSCSLALLASAMFAADALAADANVTFRCCAYTPNDVRILPNETVTIAPEMGVAFENHPLHYTDNVGNTLTGTTPAERTFPQDGVYRWYCGIHGHYDATTDTVTGMSGHVEVTYNHLPVASFTATATNVASGTEVTFDASGSSDPDPTQFLNYSWDLDGNGVDDPGQTSVNPSAVFTNSGTAPRNVVVRLTVTDTNSDAVGPESTTKTMVITVQPPPGSGGGGSAGGGDSAPPPGGGGGGGQTTDTTAPVVQLTIARSLTVGKALRVPFTTDESTSVTAKLKVGKKTANASKDFAAAGKHTLTIKLSKALRRALHKRRSVTLTLAATDDAGNGTTVKRTLKLRARS
jgi:plastocyanin